MADIANAELPDLPKEWRCTECGQMYEEQHLLRTPNPFNPDEEILGCPNCKEVGSFRLVCQVGDCEQEATSGRPRFRGFRYAFLCWKHYDEPE